MKKKEIPGGPSRTQGPNFENFDFAYESEQIQKMATQSDKANLADIDRQLAAANKEIERLAGRVSQLGRSGAQQIKAQEYENKVITTKRFLESEREQVVKILEEKKSNLPKSYSSASEEKNIANKTIQGPPQISQAPVVEPPKYTAIVDPMGAATIGLEAAPAQEPVKPKPTAVGQIKRKKPTLKEVTLDTGEVIKYESPGSLVLPEATVGRTATGKAIKSTGPIKEYLDERMPMSDQEVIQKYEKMGADYQAKLAQEQIDNAKYEFDFKTGEVNLTTGDEFEKVSSQEMFVRSSGRSNQVVVPATEANKAIENREAIKNNAKPTVNTVKNDMKWEDVQREKAQRAKQSSREKFIGDKSGVVPNENARTYGITDEAKRNQEFKISSAAKAAAASKVAKAIKKSKGLGMLNLPIMTRGSAEQIFKDFLGKKDYSS